METTVMNERARHFLHKLAANHSDEDLVTVKPTLFDAVSPPLHPEVASS